ncbi:tetratricopeptide repeat protein [Aquimarina sp. RZ0]|uniref:tetratricopeptide repeat protein n=1 Tax=Aquimarina sp. RZ0 TaxID=2607730 RepID=UPI0011F0AB29|nr:hypothetical protein [Aquimarina sp. RZ0]KAA1247140.1 hypothetical protein F0000_04325 [Aquimarina sp. RZ0]
MERKKVNNILGYFFFLMIPLVIFFVITARNRSKIENTSLQSQKNVIRKNKNVQQENNLINLGIQYINQKKYQKSIEINHQVLDLNPNNKLAHNNLCYAYGKIKKIEKGIRHCNKAILLDPDFQLAKNNLQLLIKNNSN